MISIITFNSFPGSPLPFVRNGTAGIGQTSRLRKQLDALRDLPQYDVACFQEVFSRKAVRSFVQHHRRLGMLPLYNGNTRFAPLVLIGLATFGFVAIFAISGLSPIARGIVASVGIAACWAILKVLEEFACLAFSILSNNQSGLMTFYNARRLHWLETKRLQLPNQSYDVLNLFQPRECHIHIFYDILTKQRVLVANTHLNALGSNTARLEQLDYIRRAIAGFETIPSFLCGDFNVQLKTYSQPLITWDPDNNPLCAGWMRNLEACQVDYIETNHHVSMQSTRVFDMNYTSDHYLIFAVANYCRATPTPDCRATKNRVVVW